MPDDRETLESHPSRRPRHRRMRAIFLRGLGAVYLAAFASLAVQVDGLIGSRGILPAAEFLDAVGPILGNRRYAQLPTLLWLGCSDRALHLLCWGGVAVSGLLVAGVLPRVCLIALWLGYLSLVAVGQPFLGYQWDTLLLEAGLLGVLFAPWSLWLGWARREPSLVVVWLIRWLVFRLMFESGRGEADQRRPNLAGLGTRSSTTTRHSPCRPGRAGTCTSSRAGSRRSRLA